MSSADGRHLGRMLACIAAMRKGTVGLVPGADSLLFLRNALEDTDESWAKEFTSHVATLESAGLANSDQVTAMGEQYAAVVSKALDGIEELVRNRAPSAGVAAVEEDA